MIALSGRHRSNAHHKKVHGERQGGDSLNPCALTLQEANYPPVQYIPRADADMSLLSPTAQASHCPYKGAASYFTINAGGRESVNAVWSYAAPFPAMAEIAGHLAFYPDRVDGIEESP